jgi:hypothetical protein
MAEPTQRNAADRPVSVAVPSATGPFGTDPRSEPILQFFSWEHLPPRLQHFSRPFSELARQVVESLPRNPERTVALRKLLEAKDAAVRAAIYQEAAAAPRGNGDLAEKKLVEVQSQPDGEVATFEFADGTRQSQLLKPIWESPVGLDTSAILRKQVGAMFANDYVAPGANVL